MTETVRTNEARQAVPVKGMRVVLIASISLAVVAFAVVASIWTA